MRGIKYLAAIFLIVLGCAKEERLVTIAEKTYSIASFKERYQFSPTDDSLTKIAKLNDFINEMLAITEARSKGYENDPVVRAAFETHRKEIIGRGYYEARVVKKIKISDSEARKIYDQSVEHYHLAQIVLASESVAQDVAKELKKGVPFDSLLKFSLDTLTKNGDIGKFSAITLPPEILGPVKKTRVGSVTDLIKFGDYFYFLKVLDRLKLATPKFSEVKENIKNNLLRQKIMEQGERFRQDLVKKAKIEFNQEGLAILAKPESLVTEKDLNTWVVKKYDTAYVYVKTVIEAVRYHYQRSSIDPKLLLERALYPDLLYDAALQARAERYPEVKRKLENALNTLIYQKFYSDEVLEKVVIDSTDVKNYYKRHQTEYKDKKWEEVYALLATKLREEKINSLRKDLFEKLRKKYNPVVNEKNLAKLL